MTSKSVGSIGVRHKGHFNSLLYDNDWAKHFKQNKFLQHGVALGSLQFSIQIIHVLLSIDNRSVIY